MKYRWDEFFVACKNTHLLKWPFDSKSRLFISCHSLMKAIEPEICNYLLGFYCAEELAETPCLKMQLSLKLWRPIICWVFQLDFCVDTFWRSLYSHHLPSLCPLSFPFFSPPICWFLSCILFHSFYWSRVTVSAVKYLNTKVLK